MSSTPQVFAHISKKSKPNENMFNYQCPLNLSPPNVNPKIDHVLDQIKGSSKRFFFDHSSGMLIDRPSLDSDSNRTYRRFFVTLSRSKFLEKEEVVTSFEPKEQTMKEVLSLYPENKFFESMVEMVTTRLEGNLIVDSDYLEELLALYLVHNEESLYGHIFSAYVRVMVDMSHTFG